MKVKNYLGLCFEFIIFSYFDVFMSVFAENIYSVIG